MTDDQRRKEMLASWQEWATQLLRALGAVPVDTDGDARQAISNFAAYGAMAAKMKEEHEQRKLAREREKS